MLKRYVFEVFADTQEAAENKLIEEGQDKYYLLTTEPVTEPLRKLKEAKERARESYVKILQKNDDVVTSYYEGYADALSDLLEEMGYNEDFS